MNTIKIIIGAIVGISGFYALIEVIGEATSSAEMGGAITAFIVLGGIAGWLVYSGIKGYEKNEDAKD